MESIDDSVIKVKRQKSWPMRKFMLELAAVARDNGVKLIGLVIGLFFRWLFSGKRKTANGYIERRRVFGHPLLEHREVAEEVLKRKLERWEVVHHINGRRSDNRPSNLCVMSDDDHIEYHAWYDWIRNKYGVYPRRVTQLKKLKEDFGGILLEEVTKSGQPVCYSSRSESDSSFIYD